MFTLFIRFSIDKSSAHMLFAANALRLCSAAKRSRRSIMLSWLWAASITTVAASNQGREKRGRYFKTVLAAFLTFWFRHTLW
jgi:hypothetical protein